MILSKREAIYRRDGRTCVYCRRDEETLSPENPLTLDHLVPVVEGGTGAPSNLVTSCSDCNKRKGRMSLEWFVGSKRAAEITALAKKPIHDNPPKVTKKAAAPRTPPPYPTSVNNKLHDLVRDLVAMIGDDRTYSRMRQRAHDLGVKFPVPSSGGFAGIQGAIDDGRIERSD